ncbi:MAG: 50S ribosomal protein L3 N(5)-glutamine methyltransferase [Gammaproteobacteria bacterium]|nr:50S ribosomal protein L3 N(5)-glutamine methyltransferase [Gammaproteobacteria bacterium]
MTREALQAALERADDHEEWVRVLADYFDAAGLFYGHGTDNAGDEAFWLIRHLQGWREGAFEAKPDASLAGTAAEIAERRATLRKPLAYLLGEAWFAGLPFHVDENVLIPRSPLAEVIEGCFAPWVAIEPGVRILDVGTGSGCLAIAAAVHCDGVIVDATDVSKAALAIARRNVERHGVADRVRLIEADLFPSARERYRVIMSNPPYVPARQLESLPPEYRHEPALALVGGETGVEPAERLLEAAGDWLEPGGILLVEVGAEAEPLIERHPRLPFTWLELERGGEGVFVVTAEQLAEYRERSR